MANQRITAYICPIFISALEYQDLSNISTIEYEHTKEGQAGTRHAEVITKMHPAIPYPGCSLARAKITTKLCSAYDEDCPYCNLYPNLGWKRPVEVHERGSGFDPRYEPKMYILTTWNNPEHCHFETSRIILAKGPRTYNQTWAVSTPGGNGEIPIKIGYVCSNQHLRYTTPGYTESGGRILGPVTWHSCGYETTIPVSDPSPIHCPQCGHRLYPAGLQCLKDDVFTGDGEQAAAGIQEFAVPGDKIYLNWIFNNKVKPVSCDVKSVYFHTPLTTGGKITEVIGDYGDIDIKYKVTIEGHEDILCSPTDFAHYAVDDWVFIMKTNDIFAQICDRIDKGYTEYGDYFGPSYDDYDSNTFVAKINIIRAANNLEPLTINGDLTSAAMAHCNDMATAVPLPSEPQLEATSITTYLGYADLIFGNSSSAHRGTDGSYPEDRIRKQGYLHKIGSEDPDEEADVWAVGENLAASNLTMDSVIEDWMSESDNAKNILSSTFKEIGVATQLGREEWLFPSQGPYNFQYWCVTFGYNDSHDAQDPVTELEYEIIPFRINDMGPGG